jgi:hypothetical protein
MLSMHFRAASLLGTAWLVVGCGSFGGFSLRTDATRQGSCSIGVGRDATIHGSVSDPRLAWAIDNSSGRRVELIWPVGYSARFSPQLVVVDRGAKVVAHEGDLIIGSCLNRPEDADAIQIDPAEIRPPTWQPGDG